jgi:hypothetical protein
MTGSRSTVALLAVASLAVCARLDAQTAREGLIRNAEGACEGYTLFAPIRSTTTYLIDMDGNVVHTWESERPPGQAVYLLESGHLLRSAQGGRDRSFHGGGIGGRIEEFDWYGRLVWEFDYSSENHCQHHDIEPLPNGNVLVLAWERKTREEALAAGRNPELLEGDELWPDHVVEIKPQGKSGGEIVWEWHVWDHLVQDFDESKENYGVVAEHPELIDINFTSRSNRLAPDEMRRLRALGYIGGDEPEQDEDRRPPDGRRGRGPGGQDADWNHTNSIAYNAELDQIVLSVLGFNEIWVIDHSTSSAQAAGHTGGRGGRGGDLLYRWGNPQAYRAGDAADQQLFAQHDARWIEGKAPRLLVFNNGRGRPDGNYSSIDELVMPLETRGTYRYRRGSAWLPAEPAWRYSASPKREFFSGHISGAQRLANGNTLVCSGEQGRLFEVTGGGKIVWEYVNPYGGDARMPGPPPGFGPPRGGPTGDGGDGERRRPPRIRRGHRPDGPSGGPRGRGRPPGPGGGPGGRDEATAVFRATRLAPDHPGLAGRDLSPQKDYPGADKAAPGATSDSDD